MLILAILTTNSFAQNAAKIDKGEKSPFSGIVVKEDIFNGLVKSDKKVLKLEDLRVVQDDLIDYHKDEAKKYRKELTKEKIGSTLSSTGYFVLGVVIASLGFKIQQTVGGI